MSAKDGGPAFPRVGEGFGNPHYDTPGMSLRDYFAGQALASGDCPHNVYEHAACASWAWARADAMLAERSES